MVEGRIINLIKNNGDNMDITLYCPDCDIEYETRVNMGEDLHDILERHKCKICGNDLIDYEECDMLTTEKISEDEENNLIMLEEYNDVARTMEKLYEKSKMHPYDDVLIEDAGGIAVRRELGSKF